MLSGLPCLYSRTTSTVELFDCVFNMFKRAVLDVINSRALKRVSSRLPVLLVECHTDLISVGLASTLHWCPSSDTGLAYIVQTPSIEYDTGT